ncbi:MAG: YcaO-like family protein [Candidatus Dojkabacteria bacterium]
MSSLSHAQLLSATGYRCGVTLPPQEVEITFSDMEGYHNFSVPEDSVQPWKTASGSMHRDAQVAKVASVCESLERYAAAMSPFPLSKAHEINEKIYTYEDCSLFSEDQYRDANFEWRKPDYNEAHFTTMFSCLDNSPAWFPHELVGLGPRIGQPFIPSTSTGLAAHTEPFNAMLNATLEVLERDALSTTWLNSLGGREIELSSKYLTQVAAKQGKVYCFDITQAWNPCPVIIVCGHLPLRGLKRYSMGVACRATHEEAIEKAFTEWLQGTVFAGFYFVHHPELQFHAASDVRDFDEHAVYYTIYPEKWDEIPLIQYRSKHELNGYMMQNTRTKYSVHKKREKYHNRTDVITPVLKELRAHGIELYYRHLYLPDLEEVGLTAVRVFSPQLSLIHGDERAPFLGGRTHDVAWRYPDLEHQKVIFPNPYPHPLG